MRKELLSGAALGAFLGTVGFVRGVRWDAVVKRCLQRFDELVRRAEVE